MIKSKRLWGSLLLSATLVTGAHAAVSQAQANKLGNSLTPFGAEVAGNGVDVSTGLGIPAWTGGITANMIPDTYTHAGQFHPNPFASDDVIFTINVQNKAQYADKMTIGTKAMMSTYPDTFHMNVYPSRRSASAPQWVYDNTKRNAVVSKLANKGEGVKNAFGGIPFPILSGTNSEKALQAVWNHILRWRGVFLVLQSAEVPVQKNGDYVPVVTMQKAYFPYYDPRKSRGEINNTLLHYMTFIKSPPRLAGGAILVRDPLNQYKESRQAWGYNPGLRRVRRAPTIGFDMPVPEADGLRTADQVDMFNGSTKKYNWTLAFDHPVERFIPYNSYKLDDPSLSIDDVIQPGHINSDLVRWELHRVWVVEATLKKGERHIYHKRRFYIDADSWQIVEEDVYDSHGDLWRVSLAYTMNFYEAPTVWTAMAVHYDLKAKRYDAVNVKVDAPKDVDMTQPLPGPRYFSPATLARQSR